MIHLPTSTDPVVVHEGDALPLMRSLPENTFDAVITDPPYASGGVKAAERGQTTAKKYSLAYRGKDGWSRGTGRPDFDGDQLDQRVWSLWCREWLEQCHRVLKPGGYCLSFIDWRQLPALTDCFQLAGLSWRGVLAWDKGASAHAPKPGYFRRQCEFVVWATKGPVTTRSKAEGGGLFPGCHTCPVRQSEKFHQTGKPPDVMRWLVSCVPAGGLVLDPFAGSGTTGVVCREEGRRCVLVEKCPAYLPIIRRRLAA